MSNRRRKLTLTPRPGGFGELPAPDDPGLPRLVAYDCAAGRPRWWAHAPPPGLAALALRARHGAATHVGLRRRRNDDVAYIDNHRGLYVVCDGVGGRPHGGVAAYEAAEAIQAWIGRATPLAAGWAEDAVADASRLVYEALQRASQAVYRRAGDDPDLSGMCTTASLVLVHGNFAVIGQVGDSRVYLARGDGLIQLTEDHTLRNLMIRQGLARPDAARQRSPITRAIGRQPTVAADVMALPLVAGDRLLLCTDGLHSTLADDDLLALFELDVADAALAAVRRANDLGGPDNVTAIFVELAA
jgi:serine/threonine protein phosphatase PrpC